MDNLIRQPVVVVLGHVDSGKTSLLDKIRGTAVQSREAGGMTQHIGASFFPIETLIKMCGHLLGKLGGEIHIPGLLVIDTPGHEVFTNLRSRGGSAADISIVVVDALKGFELQTYESLEILKARKVPFVVALNKIDRIPGWKNKENSNLIETIKLQPKPIVDVLDGQIYSVVGTLSKLGFESEAFYRVKDFTREISIVPVSAITSLGIPELMTVLIGMAQQYLEKKLTYIEGCAKGIVLEVNEEIGLGQTANIILLNGSLRISDQIVLGKRDGVVTTKVKGIFMPKPLDEMRDPRDKFTPVNEIGAAAGIKIVTSDLEGVLAGSPLIGVDSPTSIKNARLKVEDEFRGLFVETNANGLVVKCDTIGSLEAIVSMLREKSIPIRIADIGPVTRRDVVETSAVMEKEDLIGVILSFGVKILPDAAEEISSTGVKIFSESIIYSLIEKYLDWVEQEKQDRVKRSFSSIILPSKFKILRDTVFRRSSPAVFGVEIIAGRLRQKSSVINSEGKTIGTVSQIQDKGNNIPEAEIGSQVAISMTEPTVGRQIHEEELLYAMPNSRDVKLLNDKLRNNISDMEFAILEEIIVLRRKVSPLYAY